MKRLAMIISNPGRPGSESYCKGVLVDVDNYKNFLTSPVGGAWSRSEILHLSQPTKAKVDQILLQMAEVDYSLIIFVGHGYYSASSNSTILELDDGVEYDSTRLRIAANKRTIILDCCRKVYDDFHMESRSLMKFAESSSALDPIMCRHYYDQRIESCPNAIVVGYGCSINEVSGDSATKGGYYSSNLIKASEDWHENSNINLTQNFAIFSFVQAHNEADLRVNRISGGTQNPDIEKPRSGPYFPFAVMA